MASWQWPLAPALSATSPSLSLGSAVRRTILVEGLRWLEGRATAATAAGRRQREVEQQDARRLRPDMACPRSDCRPTSRGQEGGAESAPIRLAAQLGVRSWPSSPAAEGRLRASVTRLIACKAENARSRRHGHPGTRTANAQPHAGLSLRRGLPVSDWSLTTIRCS